MQPPSLADDLGGLPRQNVRDLYPLPAAFWQAAIFAAVRAVCRQSGRGRIVNPLGRLFLCGLELFTQRSKIDEAEPGKAIPRRQTHNEQERVKFPLVRSDTPGSLMETDQRTDRGDLGRGSNQSCKWSQDAPQQGFSPFIAEVPVWPWTRQRIRTRFPHLRRTSRANVLGDCKVWGAAFPTH